MRHRKSGRHLNRNRSHLRAMFKNMSTSLVRHELIKTTVPKAWDRIDFSKFVGQHYCKSDKQSCIVISRGCHMTLRPEPFGRRFIAGPNEVTHDHLDPGDRQDRLTPIIAQAPQSLPHREFERPARFHRRIS